MKVNQKVQPPSASKNPEKSSDKYFSEIQKKEKMLSIGIYSLIIIITIALMLILINVIIKI